MTQEEEYKGKHQRLSYLVQLLTFFITMAKANEGGLEGEIVLKKLKDKIRELANEELKEELKVI